MVFDSVAALTLFLSAIAAWWLSRHARAAARFPLRFGAVLFAAFAVSWGLGFIGYPELMPVVAMMALSLGAAALALSLFAALGRPLLALASVLGLMLALFAALAAPLAGSPLYAQACAVIAALLVMGMSISRFTLMPGRAMLAMGAMLALNLGGFAMLAGAWAAILLLFSAGLVGAARVLKFGVENRQQRESFAISPR
jgi:hypothetical protein